MPVRSSEQRGFVKPFLSTVKFFADFTCLDSRPPNIGSAGQHSSYIASFGAKRCVHTYTAQSQKNHHQSSGTYVRSETSENPLILGLATASIPKKPQTRRPAAFVILLQYTPYEICLFVNVHQISAPSSLSRKYRSYEITTFCGLFCLLTIRTLSRSFTSLKIRDA